MPLGHQGYDPAQDWAGDIDILVMHDLLKTEVDGKYAEFFGTALSVMNDAELSRYIGNQSK